MAEPTQTENVPPSSEPVSAALPPPTPDTTTKKNPESTGEAIPSGPREPSERMIKVYNPPAASGFRETSASTPMVHDDGDAGASGSSARPLDGAAPPTVSEDFFEPTLADVQSYHASVVARSKRLNEAPLLTAKHRDEERREREKRKAEKWPNTTIRIKFSDGTLVQSVFPSSSPIQPVYAFIRTTLREDARSKPFILWQPPRTQYPEHPAPSTKKTNPYKTSIIAPANYGPVRGSVAQGLQGGTGGSETLNELGLVPQSVLMIRWEEEEWNASGFPAPIRDELKMTSEPLPPPKTAEEEAPKRTVPTPGQPGEKKIPKWLQKGLMKKK